MSNEWRVASTPRGFAFRLALFYGALFLVAGTKLPYFPVWLNDRGLTTGEIAVVVAMPLFVRIAGTPAIGLAADMHGDRRRAVMMLAWGAFAAFLLLIPASGFAAILAITVLLSVATTSMMPLTETVAMAGVRRHGLDYGRMRLWGSLTFIAASFAAGFAVERAGAGVVLWLLIVGAGATVAAAHLLPPPDIDGDGSVAGSGGRQAPTLAEALKLILSPRFAIFILAVGSAQASHAVFYTFGVLHWQSQGVSSTTAGMLWAIGVVAEIGLFAWSRTIVARIGALRLLLAGAGAGVVRWAAMALDPGLAALFLLQALHGLTYGAAHIGAVHWMSERVPQAQAGTAQSVYAAVTHGIAMGLATVAAGVLYATWQGGAYLAMAILSGLGLAAGLALARIERRGDS
jgi:MFS transporter, PPP family, 3-phenylpropionic acid transporter